MRKTLILLAFAFVTYMGKAQISKVDYSLEFNEKTCEFDMYFTVLEGKTKTVPHRAQLNSQITVVAPQESNVMVTETYNPIVDNQRYRGSESAIWEVTTIMRGPEVAPKNSYHSITPVIHPAAFYGDLVAGDKVKLFSVSVEPMVNCASDVRLFENDSDPLSHDAGMKGTDFRNGFTVGAIIQSYNDNTETVHPTSPQIGEFKKVGSTINANVTVGGADCQSALTYEWLLGNRVVKKGEDAPVLTNSEINSGKYSLRVTDGLGCVTSKTVKLGNGNAGQVIGEGQATNENSESISSIEETAFSSSIFPNPAKDFTNLNLVNANGKPVVVNIADMQGKVVKPYVVNEKSASATEYKVSLSGLPNGVYSIQVTIGDTAPVSHRLIVIE